MRIHSLGNSGFALVFQDELLVIDCYNPNAHELLSPDALNAMRQTSILISHSHYDHYAKDIWNRRASYVAGYDVLAEKGTISMRPGETAEVNGMEITAFGSTDEGVSFWIKWHGKSIFHAGDLNDWHWRDEGGDEYADKAEAWFLKELTLIKESVPHIDLAFFPVDPRIGNDYYKGAVLFAKAMRPDLLIPMHYRGTFSPPSAFYAEMDGVAVQPILEKEMLELLWD